MGPSKSTVGVELNPNIKLNQIAMQKPESIQVLPKSTIQKPDNIQIVPKPSKKPDASTTDETNSGSQAKPPQSPLKPPLPKPPQSPLKPEA